MDQIFTPHGVGDIAIRNRVVMAPMTRARRRDTIANAQTAEYYRQRAGAGLIITEGTPISPEGQGYAYVPGIWSDEQVIGWRGVTDAVHEADGRIFAQLWHVGRMSHVSLQPGGQQPVSASDVAARNKQAYAFLEDGSAGFVDVSAPRPLAADEITRVAEDFVRGGINALAAGFDGVELHSANGYLFEQFLNPMINTRTDEYGGSVENRARFLLDTLDLLIAALGDHRVGVRLSPFSQQFDMPPYSEAEETYLYLATELSRRALAYVHLNDNHPAGEAPVISREYLGAFRAAYRGTVILAGEMTHDKAEDLLQADLIDLAAFGQPFIANPDLVERLRNGWPLESPAKEHFYGGGDEGYIDYPRFEPSTA